MFSGCVLFFDAIVGGAVLSGGGGGRSEDGGGGGMVSAIVAFRSLCKALGRFVVV